MLHSNEEPFAEVRRRVISQPAPADPHFPVLTIPPLLTAEVLSRIDELGKSEESATGALVFSALEQDLGAILVEKGRVCWAMARGLNARLTDILEHSFNASFDRELVDRMIQECRENNQPFGEYLVARGIVTSLGLRSALRQQTVEAIASIAAVGASPRWLPHKNRTYNPDYSFSTAELLAALGLMRKRDLADRARAGILQMDLGAITCAAYARDGGGQPLLVDLQEQAPLTIAQVHQLARLAQTQLDVGAVMSPQLRLAVGSNGRGQSVVSWQEKDLMFVALCPDTLSMARLFTKAKSYGGNHAQGASLE